jgi:ABC-type multidrug transport system permease subunit
MTSLVKTIGVFSKEKQIANQERARGLYNPGPLATAKVIAETPLASIYPLLFGAIVYPSTRLRPSFDAACKFAGIVTLESFSASGIGLAISAATPSYEAASAVGPSIMTMFIVFSSFAPKTPWVLSWIPKISVIGRAVEALMLNEVRYSELDIPFFHNS